MILKIYVTDKIRSDCRNIGEFKRGKVPRGRYGANILSDLDFCSKQGNGVVSN